MPDLNLFLPGLSLAARVIGEGGSTAVAKLGAAFAVNESAPLGLLHPYPTGRAFPIIEDQEFSLFLGLGALPLMLDLFAVTAVQC